MEKQQSTVLAKDLSVLAHRRRVLALLGGGAGYSLLGACGAQNAGGGSLAGIASSAAGQCLILPEETNGPYPADGSNNANGSLANILLDKGIVRQDARASFGEFSGVASGVRLDLKVKISNAAYGCSPLEGAAIYIWHCDAAGKYSIYNLNTENYLRAVGVSNTDGDVLFTTIYPGCYRGRLPHIHFEVYPSLEAASVYGNRALCSQIAFPDDISRAIYEQHTDYPDSLAPFEEMSLSNDNVFGDNSDEELAAQTLALSGDMASGYTGEIVIALDPNAEPKAPSMGPGGPGGPPPGGRPPGDRMGPPPDGEAPAPPPDQD